MPRPKLVDHTQVAELLGVATYDVVRASNSGELNGRPFPRPVIVEVGDDDVIALVWSRGDIAKFAAGRMEAELRAG